MTQHFRQLLLVLGLSFLLVACSKEQLVREVPKPVTSNLSESQEQEIFNELARLAADTTPLSQTDRQLLDELKIMARDIDVYYEGVDEISSLEDKYNRIRQNMRNRVEVVRQMASDHYSGNVGRITLTINSYVLMSYNALERYASEFMWTKLGLFAANEVRCGISLSYLLRHILVTSKVDLVIDGLSGVDVPDMLFESSQILIGGQISVFTDIGALGLLSHKYGPDKFINESWLTEEARQGYAVQFQAEEALRRGDRNAYYDLQTEAAILFGAHEQLYTLDPLWNEPLMGQLSSINEWLIGGTQGKLAMFGDIFIGTNKFTEFLFGYVVKIPLSYTDLTNGVDRVEIARNGFHSLNTLRKQDRWKKWVEYSENRLGSQVGIYQVKGIKL